MKRRAPPLTLVAWVVIACAALWFAPRPPPAPPMTHEEKAAMQRATDLVVRDVQTWEREHGDLTVPWSESQGQLAIVIDDVGRELHLLEKLTSLRFRLTFSVLPGSSYAAGAQLRLRADRRRHREILLHLPMEPVDASQMSDGPEADETFLLASDGPATLRSKFEDALQRVPAAAGVNNHMGSRLTTDREAMDTLMATLRDHELFFVDSRTTAETTAEAAARSAGVATLPRHVFLDNIRDPEEIEAALEQAAEKSAEHPVIAIGHPSAELIEVLERRLPELHRRGIGVYPLSWVVTRSQPSR